MLVTSCTLWWTMSSEKSGNKAGEGKARRPPTRSMLERPPVGAANDGRASEDILRATAPVQQLRVTAADDQRKAHETKRRRNSSSKRRYRSRRHDRLPRKCRRTPPRSPYRGGRDYHRRLSRSPEQWSSESGEEEANKNGGRRGYGRRQKDHAKRRASLSSSSNTSFASPLPKVTKFCISFGKNWYGTICRVKERRVVSLRKTCVWVMLSPHAVVSLHVSYA
jgi:hypothetical protein